MANAERLIKSAQAAAKRMTGETSGGFYHAAVCGALQAHIQSLCRKLAEFEAPKTGRSERECMYAHDRGEFVVRYDLEEADDEVGYSGSVCINAIYANGMNVQDSLDPIVISAIEDKAVETADQESREAEADAAINRWESRRDDQLMGAV